MEFLKGKKTIIGSIAGAVVTVAWSLGLIDDATAKMLLGIVVAWTGVSLRLAIKGVEDSAPSLASVRRFVEQANREGNGRT